MMHRLNELLKERGAKVRLAEAIGTSPGVVSDLCSGKARLNEDYVEKISKSLNIPAWHIFADPEKVYPRHEKSIVSAYLALEEDDRKIVDKFMFPDRSHFSPSDTSLNPIPDSHQHKGHAKEKR